ncbi:MAG: hypothetical protein NTZ87_02300 [Candidatus Nomurabacteria bacterium]|nr:hypothetical protein [Candidatus Nomurabacteria bacterium]
MKSEIKNCQNCKKDFTIEPDDFGFYEKIKVPPPTFCPDCRLQRRMSWRNDWRLFKKKDIRTGEKIFSFFPEESPVKIFDRDFWISDAWNGTEYGKEYDFSRPFFVQFKELLYSVPLPAHSMINIVNSHYCTNANNIKGCYLVRGASYTEDSAYLIWDQESKQCLDSHITSKCELSYGNVNTIACYRTFFSVDCESCQEIILCKDCVGCNSCFGSVSLRNKSYCIFNEQYSREEYLKKIIEFNLGSEKSFQVLKSEAHERWIKYPQKYIHGRHNANVSGDYIYESKNAQDCYRAINVEDGKYIQNILTGPVRDCYDYSNYGDNVEMIYESLVIGDGMSNVKFSTQAVRNGKNLTYCVFCFPSCSDLFGCISLCNKKYCILNKQYTKEEYEELVPKIIKHMNETPFIDQKGRVFRYGEFFPSEFSPFSYQTTAACEFFPLSKAEAQEKGFVWYEPKKQNYTITLENKNIPDNIKDVDESIFDQVIECAHRGTCGHECTGAFRVIKMELDFLKRMNIPLPRLCTNCRHFGRLSLRNPPKFYNRVCMCEQENHFHGKERCVVEFKTSYAPDRPEKVYCEKCYQQEVY